MDYINHLPRFKIQALARISDWLPASGALFVDISFPDLRYDPFSYFIRSIQDLRLLVMKQSRCQDVSFSIHRDTPYTLRGIANKDLLESVLQEFPEGKEFYSIPSYYYPDELPLDFTVDSQQIMLIHLFHERWGHPITVGSTLREGETLDNIVQLRSGSSTPQEHLVYEPYDAHPERYQWIVEMWHE